MRSAFLLVGLVAMSVLVAVATGTSSPPIEAQGVSGADLYVANCAACHQVNGEGVPGAFPPLADNQRATDADYVATVVTDGLDETIEVLGEIYSSPMAPITGLSDSELDVLVEYVVEIADGAGESGAGDGNGDGGEPEPPTAPLEPPTAGGIDAGQDLFIGQNRLDEGGSACAACHTAGEVGNLGGSSLGPDLTDTYELLGGQAGLSAWLANPPSPTMTPIYSDRPLTEDEISDLVAFLADAPNQDRSSSNVDWLLIGGLAGLIVLIGGMAIAWRGPRRTYVETLRSKR